MKMNGKEEKKNVKKQQRNLIHNFIQHKIFRCSLNQTSFQERFPKMSELDKFSNKYNLYEI